MMSEAQRNIFLVAGKPGSGSSEALRQAVEVLRYLEKDRGVYGLVMGEEIGNRPLGLWRRQRRKWAGLEPETPYEQAGRNFSECLASTSLRSLILVEGYPRFPADVTHFKDALRSQGGFLRTICEVSVSDNAARAGWNTMQRPQGAPDTFADQMEAFHHGTLPALTLLENSWPYTTHYDLDGEQHQTGLVRDILEAINCNKASLQG